MDFILWTIIGVLIFIVYSFWWVLRQLLHSLHDLVNNSKYIGESINEILECNQRIGESNQELIKGNERIIKVIDDTGLDLNTTLTIGNSNTTDLANKHGYIMGK